MVVITISKSKLINKKDIGEELFPIWLSDVDYVTKSGDIYLDYGNDKYYKRKIHKNNHNGYLYVSLKFKNGKIKQKRHHIIMAKTFIFNPNPKIYNVVGHKNNDKSDNRIENLYWTANQKNTQKAVDDGLNKPKTAQDNQFSEYIKVLDKNTFQIVGVYGSLRECNRRIKNSTLSSISRMYRKNKLYKPRSKKFIYMKSSKEEFDKYPSLQNVELVENLPADKSPKVFRMTNIITKESMLLDNQTEAERITGIPQAYISYLLKENIQESCNGWKFEFISSISYKESSSYSNLLDTVDSITVKNIYDNRIMEFNSTIELKEYFNLNGNDINHYLKTDQILLSEWKVISKNKKYKNELQKVG